MTRCRRGHSMEDAYRSNGKRFCRTCHLDRLNVKRYDTCLCGMRKKKVSERCRHCSLQVRAQRLSVTFGDRFWARINKTDGCWLWLGAVNNDGYGDVRRNGRVEKAHRVAYELTRGAVPDGLELDHLCKTTRCVNPSHLEAVTHRENVLRGNGYFAKAFRGERGYNKKALA